MDLFQTLGTLELFATAIFLFIAGKKQALKFLLIWLTVVSVASFTVLAGMILAGTVSLPPTANNMAIIVFALLNGVATWIVRVFYLGKTCETRSARSF